MNVVMIGSGYVGLVSGACFAEFGADVICIDVDQDKIDRLNNNIMPIYEPGLDDLVARNVAAGRLKFTTQYDPAVGEADLVFIAVGTPTRRGDGHADLVYVYDAARQIALHLTGYTVIVDKSTVPVGTARQVERIIREENTKADFDVASNPEFLRELRPARHRGDDGEDRRKSADADADAHQVQRVGQKRDHGPSVPRT